VPMTLSPRFERTFALLASFPSPVACADLAKVYGCTQDSMANILRCLRDLGLAAPTKHGRGALWTLTPMAAHHKHTYAMAA
jgi:hypothetical protein